MLLLTGCPSEPDGTDDAGAEPGDAGRDAGSAVVPDSGTPIPDGGTDRDAGSEPPCEVGANRTAECGFCGTEAQTCEAPGVWTATSSCLGQGECSVGSVETRTVERCAEEQRICLSGCMWSDWEEVRAPGACEAGDTRRVEHPSCSGSERLLETCTDSCEWAEGVGTCVSGCPGAPARTSPEWAREVCVPEGEYIRGLDGDAFASPEASIYVSSFFIDVYPVTHRRYKACADAGVCRPANGYYGRLDPAFLDYPVQGIDRTDAETFCAWDGGRRMVRAVEWEKAARGPAPRRNRYPWGDSLDCSIVAAGQPPCSAVIEPLYAADPYNAFSVASASFYGMQMAGFGVREHIEDGWCSDWYSSPSYRVRDPLCPFDPLRRPTAHMSGSRRSLAPVFRYDSHSNVSRDDRGAVFSFRCARSAE